MKQWSPWLEIVLGLLLLWLFKALWRRRETRLAQARDAVALARATELAAETRQDWQEQGAAQKEQEFRDYLLQAQALVESVDQLTVALTEERRKCSELQGIVGGVLKEKEFWRGYYQRQASEHSAAQSYLLRQLEAVAIQYKQATGKAVKVDQAAAGMVAHFAEVHGEKARQEAEQLFRSEGEADRTDEATLVISPEP